MNANFWRWTERNYNGDAFTVGRNDVLFVLVSEKGYSLIVFRSVVAMYVPRIIRTNLAKTEATKSAFKQITVWLLAMTSITSGILKMNNFRYSSGFEVWRVKRYDFIEYQLPFRILARSKISRRACQAKLHLREQKLDGCCLF
jgi:hypothetical protein